MASAPDFMTYLAEADRESALLPLQAASGTYRIALGPRAGQKVLSLQSLPSPDKPSSPDLCAKLNGFSLHAAVRRGVSLSVNLGFAWVFGDKLK